MVWLVVAFLCYVLSYCTVSVAGQCTVSSCAVSLSESEESLQVSLHKHSHRLETMNQNMCSAFEKLEAAVNRTNARGQEELRQDLKTIYFNMSANLEKVGGNIPVRVECSAIKEQEEYLNSINLNLTSMIVRTDESVQAVNENITYVYQNLRSTLQTVNRSLGEKFQVMQVQLQSQTSAIQKVNGSLDEKFQVMKEQFQSQTSALQAVNRSLDDKFQVMKEQLQSQTSAIQTVNRSLDEKLQMMQVQLSSLMNETFVAVLTEIEVKFQTLNKTLSSAVYKCNEEMNASLNNVEDRHQSVESQDYCRNSSVVCDCSDIKANGYRTSGVYRIYVENQGQRYYANTSCDMTTTNGGWTVFQRRKDGSVDFYRNWNDYEYGFGNPNGEFWLGNNFLHLLTSKRRYRLRIDLEDFEEEKRYAEYSTFNISSSVDKYRIRIGTYSGTAGDSLSYHNNQRFSTKDSDNDAASSMNCAVIYGGAWWYKNCHRCNLNGLYLRGRYSSNGSLNGHEGIQWHPWHSQWYSLKTTEMKISSS